MCITKTHAQAVVRACPGITVLKPTIPGGPFSWWKNQDHSNPNNFITSSQTYTLDSIKYNGPDGRYYDETLYYFAMNQPQEYKAMAVTEFTPAWNNLPFSFYPAGCLNTPQEFTGRVYEYNEFCFAGNGSNTYARATFFPTSKADNFTIRAMVRIKPISGLGNAEMCIFQNGNTSHGYALLINNSTRRLSLELNGIKIVTSNAVLTEDRFYNVALSRRQGNWYITVDNIETNLNDNTAFNPHPSLILNTGFSVGARYENTAVFSGLIDEVEVFEEALTVDEVYSGTGGLATRTSAWNFETITQIASGATPNLITGKPALTGDANARACPATYVWNFNGVEQRTNSRTISYAFTSTGTKNVSYKIIAPFGCVSQTSPNKQILIKSNVQPTVSATADNNGPVCSNTTNINLTATGAGSLMDNQFEGTFNGWTSEGIGVWGLDAYLYHITPDNSRVISAGYYTSGPGPVIDVKLVSPAISTMGASNLNIEINHYIGIAYYHKVKIQASADGTNWTDVKSYPESATYGHHENFATDVITVPSSFLNKPSVKFRLSYYETPSGSIHNYSVSSSWLVNYIKIFSSEFAPQYKWTSSPAGFTSSLQKVVVKPTETTTYTVAYNTGCIGTASTTVVVNPIPAAALSVNNANTCKNGTAPTVTFTGSGSVPPYNFMYKLNNGTTQFIGTSLTESTVTITLPTNTAANYRFDLLRVTGGNGCLTNFAAGSKILDVSIRDNPSATISGTSSVCGNNIGNVILTGSNGVAPYTFAYSYNAGNVTLNNTLTTAANSSAVNFVPNIANGSTLYQINTVKDVYGCTTSYNSNMAGSNMSVTAYAKPGLGSMNIPIVGSAETSFAISYYLATGYADTYSIKAAPTGAMPGFVPVNNVTITSNPINVNIPASPVGSYKFILYLKSSTTGCLDTIPFSVGVASKNNSLRSFKILNVPITPLFDAATTNYTATLQGTTRLLKCIAIKEDPTSTMTINGAPYNSGDTVTVTYGGNIAIFQVGVTSAGNSLKNYQIVANHEAAAPPHNAIAFRGGYENMNVGSTLFNDLPTGTYELWVNPENAKPGCFMSKQNNAGGPSQSIFGMGFTQDKWGNDSLAQPGKVYFRGRPAGPIITSKNTLPYGRWSHVAVTFSTTGAKLYINGELESTATGDFSVPNDAVAKNASIGSWQAYWNYAFIGKMDEVRIWTSVRTQSEIQYALRNIIPPNATALKAYYNFDYGERGVQYPDARHVYDLTGHGFDGILASNEPTPFNWVESFATVIPAAIQATNVATTSFTANLEQLYYSQNLVDGYLLDVATDSLFTQFVPGYQNLYVTTLATPVTGLQSGTVYYYRARGEKASVTGQGAYSNTVKVITKGYIMDKLGLTANINAAPAYALRLLSASYTGPAITLRRSSDNATQNIGFDENGNLDTLALKTFSGNDTAYVVTWHDQSGYRINATQAVTTRQPYVMATGNVVRLNQRPSVYFAAHDLATAKQTIYTNGVSMTGIAKGNSNVTSTFVSKTGTAAGANENFPGPFDYANTGNEFVAGNAETFALGSMNVGLTYVDARITSAQPANIHGFDVPLSPSIRSYINGAFVGAANLSGPGDNGNALRIGNRNDMGGSGHFFTPELVLFNSIMTEAERVLATASQNDYYFNSNANLAAITTAAGPLTGKFDSLTYSYKTSLANSALTTITATPANSGAAIHIRVNGGAYVSAPNGKPSANITLNTSITNIIDIRVTAQAGNIKTYTITLVKTNALNNVNLTKATPASPAYSLRLLSSTYTGKAINVRRSSDNATMDIGFTPSGDLDTAALKTFTGSNTAYVTRWYDQSGYAVDAYQLTAALQPRIITNGTIERLNTRPAIYFATSNLGTDQLTLYTEGVSMIGVAKGNSETPSCLISKTGTAAGANLAHPGPFEYTNNGSEFTVGNAATASFSYIRTANTSLVSVIKNGIPAAVHSFVIPATIGSRFSNFVNGVEAANEAVISFMDNKNSIRIGNRNSTGSSGNLWVPEVILFNDALLPAARIAAEEAQKAYYFIPCTPVIDEQPQNQTLCPGSNLLLNAAASGYNLTFEWKKNNSVVVGTEATLLLTNITAADAGTYTCKVSGVCNNVVTNTATIIVTNPATLTIPATAITAKAILANGINYITNNCTNVAAAVQAGGSYNITGGITANIWVEQPGTTSSFVARHYEIIPDANIATATAKVILYFTQAEFTAYNMMNAVKMPANAADATGIANIRIEKYDGLTNDSTGLPASYISQPYIINPDDNNVVWNSSLSRWEVSFDVTGFGGFFAKTVTTTLPLKWLSVTGNLNTAKQAVISWKVAEREIKNYTIEKSINGNTFTVLGTVISKGDGTNTYSFTEPQMLAGTGYYRIKQTAKNGEVSYSGIIRLEAESYKQPTVLPNPTRGPVNINVSTQLLLTSVRVFDVHGKQLQSVKITGTSFIIDMTTYAQGMYLLNFSDGSIIKILKQ